MPDRKCDLSQVRSETMRLAQASAKKLKAAGVSVTSEVFSEIVKDAHRRAVESCEQASMEISPDQAKLVGELCEPCQRFYQVRGQASLDMEAEREKLRAKKPGKSEPQPEYAFTTKEELEELPAVPTEGKE